MDGAAGSVQSTDVDTAFVERSLTAPVTEEESRRFARQPTEVIAFTLLAIQAFMGGQQPGQPGPNTPPAAIPPYQQPPSRPKSHETCGDRSEEPAVRGQPAGGSSGGQPDEPDGKLFPLPGGTVGLAAYGSDGPSAGRISGAPSAGHVAATAPAAPLDHCRTPSRRTIQKEQPVVDCREPAPLPDRRRFAPGSGGLRRTHRHQRPLARLLPRPPSDPRRPDPQTWPPGRLDGHRLIAVSPRKTAC